MDSFDFNSLNDIPSVATSSSELNSSRPRKHKRSRQTNSPFEYNLYQEKLFLPLEEKDSISDKISLECLPVDKLRFEKQPFGRIHATVSTDSVSPVSVTQGPKPSSILKPKKNHHSVMFSFPIVSETKERPRTSEDEKTQLFYTDEEIRLFRGLWEIRNVTSNRNNGQI